MLARITARGSRGGREPGTCERECPSSKRYHEPSHCRSSNGLHSGASGAIMIVFGYCASLLTRIFFSDSPGGSRVFLSEDLLSSGLCLSSVYRLAVKQLPIPCSYCLRHFHAVRCGTCLQNYAPSFCDKRELPLCALHLWRTHPPSEHTETAHRGMGIRRRRREGPDGRRRRESFDQETTVCSEAELGRGGQRR